jgi:fructose-1,6-bisphosphatase/inositol monophosphatase family enzyme
MFEPAPRIDPKDGLLEQIHEFTVSLSIKIGGSIMAGFITMLLINEFFSGILDE